MKGVWFNDVHSINDFNLVLSEVNIPPAPVKTLYIDIPGADGAADLTEALGEPRYENRECTLTFTVFPWENFEEKKRQLSALLNGKRKHVTLDKDPDYYWDARCSINEYLSDRALRQIVVGMAASPYKLHQHQTTITRTLTSAAQDIILLNDRRSVVPTITCTAACSLTFKGNVYSLTAGTHKVLGILLTEGANVIRATGSGTITFTYQEGAL